MARLARRGGSRFHQKTVWAEQTIGAGSEPQFDPADVWDAEEIQDLLLAGPRLLTGSRRMARCAGRMRRNSGAGGTAQLRGGPATVTGEPPPAHGHWQPA